MKHAILIAGVFAGAVASVGAQETQSETYYGVLGNFLISSDSARDLDGVGVHALYGVKPSTGLHLEYRGFYDILSPQRGDDFSRLGGGADVLFGLAEFGVPEVSFIKPFVLAGGGLVYSDATPRGESEIDAFINVGIGAVSEPVTADGWRVRGDLKYVYENVGDGYSDIYAAVGLEFPLGAVAGGTPAAPVKVVKAAAAKPVDSDGDGVLDGKDRCPGTRAGTQVQSDGCAATTEPTAVLELRGVSFESNSEQLRDESATVLTDAATTLNSKYPDAQVEVAGHTDDLGDEAYNLDLSRRRAETVRQYLIQSGVDAARLSAVGYGEAQPVADNTTRQGRSENRRVELRVRE